MGSGSKSAKVLGDFLTKHAAERPRKEAIVFKDKRVTWAEYDRQTDLVAMGLIQLGVKKGDKIGVYIPNWPEFLLTYLGASKIGAVCVPIGWRLTPGEIKFIINYAEVSVLVMADGFFGMDFVKNLEAIRGEAPTLKHVVMLNKEKATSGMISWEAFQSKPTSELDRYKTTVEPDDNVIFIFTSGTTGVPKAAMLTHKNLIAYTNGEAEALQLADDEVTIMNLPLNHVGGASMVVLLCLNIGAKVVMMDMFDPEKTLQLIQDEKVTVLGQVPAQYALELISPNIDKYDLSSIRKAVVASQPCPSELIMAVKNKMGTMPQNAYGLTETCGAITFTKIEHGEEKLKYTVGVPMKGIDLIITDLENNILPAGQTGEIAIKGDAVMKGYWKRPDEDAKVFDKNGYFHTGDMGVIDKDGYVSIVGRKKEMYIRGGENVYPPEIEEAVAQHPDVLMVAVVGRPHPVFGEVGRAYVVPKPGTHPTAEGMKQFLKDRLAKYKIPEDIIFRDQLPLSPLGKVKKLDLYQEMEKEFAKK